MINILIYQLHNHIMNHSFKNLIKYNLSYCRHLFKSLKNVIVRSPRRTAWTFGLSLPFGGFIGHVIERQCCDDCEKPGMGFNAGLLWPIFLPVIMVIGAAELTNNAINGLKK